MQGKSHVGFAIAGSITINSGLYALFPYCRLSDNLVLGPVWWCGLCIRAGHWLLHHPLEHVLGPELLFLVPRLTWFYFLITKPVREPAGIMQRTLYTASRGAILVRRCLTTVAHRSG